MSFYLGLEIWSSRHVLCYSILSKRPTYNKEKPVFSGLDYGQLLSIYSFPCFYLNYYFHEKSRMHHFDCQVSNFSNMRVKTNYDNWCKPNDFDDYKPHIGFLRKHNFIKRLDSHLIPKIHDNYSTSTQFGSIYVALMNFIIQRTVVCPHLQEKDLEKKWERVRKFAHLNFLATNDIGIL